MGINTKQSQLHQLILSMENTELPSEIDQEELASDINEINDISVSLESYCCAYALLGKLQEDNVLSMETYHDVLSLATVNKSIVLDTQLSMEDESDTKGMLAKVKEAIVKMFTWLRDKVTQFFTKLMGYMKGSKKKLSDILATLKERAEESPELNIKEKTVPVDKNAFSAIRKGNKIYDLDDTVVSFKKLTDGSFSPAELFKKAKAGKYGEVVDAINKLGNGKELIKHNDVLLHNVNATNIFIGAAETGNNFLAYVLGTSQTIQENIGASTFFAKEVVIDHDLLSLHRLIGIIEGFLREGHDDFNALHEYTIRELKEQERMVQNRKDDFSSEFIEKEMAKINADRNIYLKLFQVQAKLLEGCGTVLRDVIRFTDFLLQEEKRQLEA